MAELMEKCVLKYDHFENIHRLPPTTLAFEGGPNFRKVPGFMVFGTGQPTLDAFEKIFEHLFKTVGAKKVKWTSMRQEPVVYVNGRSFTPREATRLNENMEFPGITGPEVDALQDAFVAILRQRAEAESGQVHYFRDTYAEHPADRKNIEHIVPLEGDRALDTISGVYQQLREKGFVIADARLPIVDEKAPEERDFDALVNFLRDDEADTACVYNCQMGKGRTTTGMILSCLYKHVVFGVGCQEAKPNADGEFQVIKDLFALLPGSKEAKVVLDHIIDLCGTEPEGTGLQNLRTCINWTKEKYDAEPDAKKPFWAHMGKNFIERYFFLVCFATYALAEAKNKFAKSFVAFMDERKELRDLIAKGMQAFAWV